MCLCHLLCIFARNQKQSPSIIKLDSHTPGVMSDVARGIYHGTFIGLPRGETASFSPNDFFIIMFLEVSRYRKRFPATSNRAMQRPLSLQILREPQSDYRQSTRACAPGCPAQKTAANFRRSVACNYESLSGHCLAPRIWSN